MQPGAVLGAYRVVRQIGAGGMGQVWVAEHKMLGRRAALKVLHPEMSAREDIVRRFFNEARAATAIPDPGIVQIFDFGYSDDGAAYIIMELLDGETLEARLARGRLEPRLALRLMRQAASTLGAAHARGIVHRDLKPDNIFIAKDPEVSGGERAKILDFGIAKLTDDRRTGAFQIAAPAMNASGVLGTPLYMSPEQCRADAVDARTDIYAIGCVLYQILTGQYPFDADTPETLILKHIEGVIPVPSTLVPDLPVSVDRIVRRCLAKLPDERFRSGTELALALAEVLGATPEPLPRAQSPAMATTLRGATAAPSPEDALTLQRAPSSPADLPTVEAAAFAPTVFDKRVTTLSRATGSSMTPPPRRRSRSMIVVISTAVAAVVVGLVAWTVGSSRSQPEPIAATAPAAEAPSAPVPTAAVTPATTAAPPVGSASPQPTQTAPVPVAPEPPPPAVTEPPPPTELPTQTGSAVPTKRATDTSTGAGTTAASNKPTPKPKKRLLKKKQQKPPPPDTSGIVLDANGVPVHR